MIKKSLFGIEVNVNGIDWFKENNTDKRSNVNARHSGEIIVSSPLGPQY